MVYFINFSPISPPENSSNVSLRLSSNAKKSIELLMEICSQSVQDQAQLQKQLISEISQSCDQHTQKLVAQMLEQMQQRELQMSRDIQVNLQEMEENNQRHKAMLDSMQEKFSQIIHTSSQSLEQHVTKVQQQLDQLSAMSVPDGEHLQQLQEELANERALAQQEETLLESLMMQMEQIKNLRAKNSQSMAERIGHMEEHRLTRNQRIDATKSGIQDYQKLGTEAAQSARHELSSQMETGMLCLDQGIAKCSMLQVHMQNLGQEYAKQTEVNVQASRLHQESLLNICQASDKQLEELQGKQKTHLEQTVAERQELITEDRQRFRGHATLASDLVLELTRQTTEHVALQRQQLQICEQEVMRFQQSELKTYAPTGTTPSKRDFVYPRSLVATSPHQDIVRRYRQEQDWSDLDTTATIDEVIINSQNRANRIALITSFSYILQCSEGEDDASSLHSVQELSETETIMNSTPIEGVDGVNRKRGCGTTRNSNSNALKPPVAGGGGGGKRSSSLSRSLTPSKSSPRGSPAFNRVSPLIAGQTENADDFNSLLLFCILLAQQRKRGLIACIDVPPSPSNMNRFVCLALFNISF